MATKKKAAAKKEAVSNPAKITANADVTINASLSREIIVPKGAKFELNEEETFYNPSQLPLLSEMTEAEREAFQ